ncbi:MAG: ABC-2 transporter permease [Eubacterium sp.]|nr:ABC-2 transporter permease [Eubacterium sp.]
MKGLLIKDLMITKKNCLSLFVISFGLFVISLISKMSVVYLYYSVAIVSIIPINTIAYDEAYKWNKYELLLPISKKTVVREKYLLSLTLVLPILLIERIIYVLVHNHSVTNILSLMPIMLFCGVIVPIVVLPIVFKFGYIKGRLIYLISLVVIASSISVASPISIISISESSGSIVLDVLFTPYKSAILFAVISVTLLLISYAISVRVYEKREI